MSFDSMICFIKALDEFKLPEIDIEPPLLLTNTLIIIRRPRCTIYSIACHRRNRKTQQYQKIPGYACKCFGYNCYNCKKFCFPHHSVNRHGLCVDCSAVEHLPNKFKNRVKRPSCVECQEPLDPKYHRNDSHRSHLPWVQSQRHKDCWLKYKLDESSSDELSELDP